jgi:KDO2-lipid IV(A) lauroyltransferase
VILVSGHFSNFYIMLGYLGRLGIDIAVLVRPFSFRPAKRLLAELSAQSGLTTFDQGQDSLKLVRHLSRGGVGWFTLDQNARHGLLIDFLGHPATTFAGPVRLARKLGLPIVPAFVHQTGPCFYELTFHPPLHLPPSKPTKEEVMADLRRLVIHIEREVYAFPQDWLWGHRRWRHGERHAQG